MSRERCVGLVGAGVAGLVAARELVRHGVQVHVFDKGRAPGGRISTRRDAGHVFDHGAQYFTTSAGPLVDAVRVWEAAGVVARWEARIVRWVGGRPEPTQGQMARWVGTPTMSAIARHLAEGIGVRSGAVVREVRPGAGGPELFGEAGTRLGRYDAVLVATPAPQAASILPEGEPRARALAVRMAPTWAVMAAFGEPVPVELDGGFFDSGPLAWVARDTSKPGRPAGERWVLHATPPWSLANLDRDREAVAGELLGAFRSVVGRCPGPIFLRGHLWRYAFPEGDVGDHGLWDAETRIGAAGDWCLPGARFEAAFLSGRAMAARVLGHATDG